MQVCNMRGLRGGCGAGLEGGDQEVKGIYIVVTVDDYIPHVQLATLDKDKALNFAKEWAKGWNNEISEEDLDPGEIYFNQEKAPRCEGHVNLSLEYAVSVQEIEVEGEGHLPLYRNDAREEAEAQAWKGM